MTPAEDDSEELYEHAPCGYLSTAPDGTIVRANRTLLDWLGYHRDDIVGKRRFVDLLSAGGRIYHETHYAPLLRMQGAVREIAVDLVCADGRRVPALVNSVLHRDADGSPVVVRTAVFAAEERREYERELLRARRRAEDSEARARVLAQTLQRSFIPPAPPAIPGFDIAGVYRPAGEGDEVGGDFYDVFETTGGDWAVVIGDVCGKGAAAAAVTALARYTVRAAAMQSPRPRRVLTVLNDALLLEDRFCTVVYARVVPPHGDGGAGTGRVAVACGGHPPPLLVRPDGDVRPVGVPGSLLGVLETPWLEDVVVTPEPGDKLVFYTDGVTEGRRERELFGEERLAELLATGRHDDASELAERIVDEVVAFQNGLPRDDIAVVVLRVP